MHITNEKKKAYLECNLPLMIYPANYIANIQIQIF